MLFTPEELEELRRLDAEIDEDFQQTPEEIRASRARDKAVTIDRMDNRRKKAAETQKAYYEANREKIAETQKAYREANREKIAESKKILLRNHRKSLGLSQGQYGAILGVSQTLISRWEKGMIPINLAFVDSVFPELGEALRKEDAAPRAGTSESGKAN